MYLTLSNYLYDLLKIFQILRNQLLLSLKGYIWSIGKGTLWIGKNIHTSQSDKGLISKIYKAPKKSWLAGKQITQSKYRKKNGTDASSEKTCKYSTSIWGHSSSFLLFDYQGKIFVMNYFFTSLRVIYIKKYGNNHVGTDAVKKRASLTSGGHILWFRLYGKKLNR